MGKLIYLIEEQSCDEGCHETVRVFLNAADAGRYAQEFDAVIRTVVDETYPGEADAAGGVVMGLGTICVDGSGDQIWPSDGTLTREDAEDEFERLRRVR